MSERPLMRGVVLAHGRVAEALVDAVRGIAGVGDDVLVPVSNEGLGPEQLSARICELAASAPTIVFTDMPTGSCGFAARRACRDAAELAVICGVNLPTLLDFVMHRDMPMEALVPRLVEKGHTAICCVPTELDADVRRPVPR